MWTTVSIAAVGKAQWHQLRTGRVTASRCGDALGFKGHAAAADIARELHLAYHQEPLPPRPAGPDVWATNWGIHFEPVAVDAYMRLVRPDVTERGTLFRYNADPVVRLGASPDALVGNDTVLEVKCPYVTAPLARTASGDWPKSHYMYWLQLQLQMYCMDRTVGELCYWIPLTILKGAQPTVPELGMCSALAVCRFVRMPAVIDRLATTLTYMISTGQVPPDAGNWDELRKWFQASSTSEPRFLADPACGFVPLAIMERFHQRRPMPTMVQQHLTHEELGEVDYPLV